MSVRLLEDISTSWAPYSVMFSRDGARLAIGGGTWYGLGGIMLVDLATLARRFTPLGDLQSGGSVSGVAFSADDRHLVASTWRSSHGPNALLAYEVEGLAVEPSGRIERLLDSYDFDTGVALRGADVLVRVHAMQADAMLEVTRFENLVIDGTQVQPHLTSSRLFALRGHIVTGDDQTRWSSAGVVPPGLVLRSESAGRITHVPAAQRVTAIGIGADHTLISGGVGGELWRWSWTAELPAAATPLGVIPKPKRPIDTELAWAAYRPASVVGICSLASGRLVAVTAGGMIATWRDDEPIVTWELPIAGSPRTIAAHPDRGIIAVGIKQGGAGYTAKSAVALIEIEPEVIERAWRTPHVHEVAAVCTPTDLASLHVLADALEEAGAPVGVHAHLRRHSTRVQRCWVLDALRTSGSPRG